MPRVSVVLAMLSLILIIYEFKQAIFSSQNMKYTRTGSMFFSVKKEILRVDKLKSQLKKKKNSEASQKRE